MIYVHGNKSITCVCICLLIVLTSLCFCKITEKKMELKKNISQFELVTSDLEKNNKKIVEEAGL